MIIDGFLCSFDFPLIYDYAWVLPAENQTIFSIYPNPLRWTIWHPASHRKSH